MDQAHDPRIDLSRARRTAVRAAEGWGIEVGPPFELSCASFVAPAGGAVIKVPWEGDDESLNEGDALTLWAGKGAVRLIARSGPALLIDRADPGDDLSTVPDKEGTAIAIDISSRLWRRAGPPFRPVNTEVIRWLDRAERQGSELVPLARELLAQLRPTEEWLVHGDFHHHNILRSGDRWLAIDPKPYLSEREYDIPSFIWNPMDNRLEDRQQTERRIAAFVAAGLDESRIRAWMVIRGAYLRPDLEQELRAIWEG